MSSNFDFGDGSKSYRKRLGKIVNFRLVQTNSPMDRVGQECVWISELVLEFLSNFKKGDMLFTLS